MLKNPPLSQNVEKINRRAGASFWFLFPIFLVLAFAFKLMALQYLFKECV